MVGGRDSGIQTNSVFYKLVSKYFYCSSANVREERENVEPESRLNLLMW